MRTAYFDVENSPSLVWSYDPYFWKGNSTVATEQPWFMLSFAWKAPGARKIHCHALPDYPGYDKDKTNDKKLIADLWTLFDSNDVLIGHNIRRFDTRKANARFIYWGMKPPSPYIILDSLTEYKKVAHLDRNKLDFIDRFIGGTGKMATTGWDMHRGAIGGNPADWNMLRRYNRVDTKKAEDIWNVIAPWKKSYINSGYACCPVPTCGSLDIHRRGPVRHSLTKFQFVCNTCGHWFVQSVRTAHEQRHHRGCG